MDDFENPIDKIIREARERGEFKDLPGKGRPLNWDADDLVPDDQRMANRLLKNNGFTPDWMMLGKELDDEYAVLQARLENLRAMRAAGQIDEAGWRAAGAQLAQKIRELNRRVIGYNVRAPHERFHKLPYPIDPDLRDGE